MAYRCPNAIIGGAREAIRCKASGSVCAHQKMCMMEGRIVLTAGAMDCPGRDESERVAVQPDIPDAGEAPETVPANDPEQEQTETAGDKPEETPAKKPGRKPAAKAAGEKKTAGKTTAKAGAKRGTGK